MHILLDPSPIGLQQLVPWSIHRVLAAMDLKLVRSRSDQLVAEEKLVAGEAPVALSHLAREIRYEPVSTLAPDAAVAVPLMTGGFRFP